MENSVSFVNISINSAEQFLESVSEPAPNTKLYFAYGKTDAWANEAAPNTVNTSVATVYEVWSNMIGAKRLLGSDFHHIIPRFNWTSGTTYTAYDHMNTTLYDGNTMFYVVTSDWNVYKCIANNASQPSTVEPTSTNPSVISATSDNYKWKYMYTLLDSDLLRFTTDQYMPVKTLSADDGSRQWEVQNNAISGAIHHIEITNGGQNYMNASNIVITISGDGEGTTATAGINNVSNTVNTITVTNEGTEYTYASVTITDAAGVGTNATARAIISSPWGHGSNPLYELGGRYLMINARLKYDEEEAFQTSNDFRQVSIIKDPLIEVTGNVATDIAISQSLEITAIGTGDFKIDELVYQGTNLASATFVGRVLFWDSSTSKVLLINTRGTPVAAQNLIGSESFVVRSVSSITTETLRKYSGKVLYASNIIAIERDPDQIEDFKVALKF